MKKSKEVLAMENATMEKRIAELEKEVKNKQSSLDYYDSRTKDLQKEVSDANNLMDAIGIRKEIESGGYKQTLPIVSRLFIWQQEMLCKK